MTSHQKAGEAPHGRIVTENPSLLKLLRDNSKDSCITVTELPTRNTSKDVDLLEISQGAKSSHPTESPFLPPISVSPRLKPQSKKKLIVPDESGTQRQSLSSVYAVANPNILRASGVSYNPVKGGYLANIHLQEFVSLQRNLVENKENQSPLIDATGKPSEILDLTNDIEANANSIDTNNNSEVYKASFKNQNVDVIERSSDHYNGHSNNMSSSKPLKRVYIDSPNLARPDDEDDFRYVNSRVEDYNEDNGNETYRALDAQHISPQQHHSPQRQENDYHRYEDRNLKMQSQNVSFPNEELMPEKQYVIRPSESKQHFLLDETGLPRGVNLQKPIDYSPEYSGSDLDELHQEKYYQDNMRVRLEEQTQRDSDMDISRHHIESDEDFQDSLDFQSAERTSFAHDSLDGDDLDPDQNYGQFRNTDWVNPPRFPGNQQSELGRRVNQPQNVYQHIPDETQNVRQAKLPDPSMQYETAQYQSPNVRQPRHIQPQEQYREQVRPNDDVQYGYDLRSPVRGQLPLARYEDEMGSHEDPYSQQPVAPDKTNKGYQQQGYRDDQQLDESVDPNDWPQGEQTSVPVREHYKGSKQPFRHVPENHVNETQEQSRYENVDEYYEEDPNAYYNQPLASSNHNGNHIQQDQGQMESDNGHSDARKIRAVYPHKPKTNYVEMNIDSIKVQGQKPPNSYAKLHSKKKDEMNNLPSKFRHVGKPRQVEKGYSLGSVASAPASAPQAEDTFQTPKVVSAENLWRNRSSHLSQQKENRLSGKKVGRLQKFPSDSRMHQSVHQPTPARSHPAFQAGPRSPSSSHTLTPVPSHSSPRRPVELQPITQEFSTADGQRISVDINLKLITPQEKIVIGPISQQQQPVGPVRQHPRLIGSMSAGTVGVPYPIQEYRQDNEKEAYDPRDIFPSPRDAMRAQQFYQDTPRLSHTHPGTNQYNVIPPINEVDQKNKQDIPYQRGNETEGYMANYQKQRNRTYDYKKYTIHDYKKLQNELSVKMGGLGPNLDDDTLKEKTEKTNKRLEYAKLVHEQNRRQVTRAKPPPHPPEPKDNSDMLDKRKIALQYAKNVPKPTVKPQESPIGETYTKSSPILRREQQEHAMKNTSPGSKRGSGISNRNVDIIDLDELQRRHEREKHSVAMIRQNVDSVLEQRA